MNEYIEETKTLSFPAESIQSIRISCRNYRVHFVQGSNEEIIVRFHNNRFHRIQAAQNGTGLYLGERMAVTFYDFFRFLELMDDNLLEIEIPADCTGLTLSVETGVAEIVVDEIHARQIYLKSSSGQINIRNAYVEEMLSAHSAVGMVTCQLPGVQGDYDIDCRADRKDVSQPYYAPNPDAEKKIILRSNMFVPELTFLVYL